MLEVSASYMRKWSIRVAAVQSGASILTRNFNFCQSYCSHMAGTTTCRQRIAVQSGTSILENPYMDILARGDGLTCVAFCEMRL